MHRPDVSVIIPCYRRPGSLRECLASLEASVGVSFEVLVVDQTGEEEIRRVVEASPLRPRYLRSAPYTSIARNLGAREARAEIVAFTDDDCTVKPDWLAKVIEPFSRPDPPDVVVGPDAEPGGTDPQGRPIPPEVLYAEPRDPWVVPGPGGGTNNLAMRRDAFLAVGGFDETIGPGTTVFGSEDVEFLYRMLRQGRTVLAKADAVIIDAAPQSAWPLLKKRYKYFIGVGAHLGREMRRGDPLARGIFWGKVWREGPVLTAQSVRKRSWLWAAAGLVQMVGAAHGRVRGRIGWPEEAFATNPPPSPDR